MLFTSGGTEADALGVLGAARAARGRHIVVSAIEHPAVMRCAEALAADGYALDLVAPAPNGVVSAEAVAAAVRPETAVVAVMLVNNELGTQQPIADVARGADGGRAPRKRRPPARRRRAGVRAFAAAAAHARRRQLAISAHKLHGPKGAGALWLRPGARIAPLWVGGGQERGLRGGTENLPALAGFGVAARLGPRRRPGRRRDRDRGAARSLRAARCPRSPRSSPARASR